MHFLLIILSFLLIFYFPLPFIGNSVIIVFFILCISIFFKKGYTKQLNIIFSYKYTRVLIIGYCIVILSSFFYPIFFSTYDFSLLYSHILTFFIVINSLMFYSFVKSTKKESYYIIKLIIILFVIQSIIQNLAFVSPFVKNIVHLFQKEEVSIKDYGGIRALALTGNPFFALASGYGLAFIIFIHYIILSKSFFTTRNIIFFILILLGSFYAGRTAFIGILFGIIYYIISLNGIRKKIFNLSKLFFYILILVIVIYQMLIPVSLKKTIDNDLLPYAFEFYYTYEATGELSTSSSDALHNMYFPVSEETLFLGDARFTGIDGRYYMHTDAGYMRYLLFYGLFGSIALIILMYKIYFSQVFVYIFSTRKRFLKNKNNFIFFITIFIYYLFIQYKGLVLFGTPIIQVLIIWLTISFLENRKYD